MFATKLQAMEKSDALKLGKIVKVQGKDGEVVCYFDIDSPERYGELQFIFIEINQRLIPFHIEALDLKANYARVRLEDISSPEEAHQIVNKEIYLPHIDLPELEDDQFYYHQLIGFSVIDRHKGEIGQIRDILERPEQSILQITYKDKEILIPLAEELITGIDRIKQEITIEAPEGLINLYLD